jgi:RimJ/RimL family protein N-acetyltransferase
MLDHLFFQIGVHRVYGYWLESHYASIRMAEKLGFRQEGILRDSVFKNGEFINVAVLSVLSSEYINV